MFITTRFPRLHRRILYTVVLLSWCSGIAFFVFSRFILIDGEFGPEKHPLQFPILQAHGAAAFCMMVGFGAIVTSHVPAAWRTGRHRLFGLTLVSAVLFLILSAWSLYYLSSDSNRALIGNIHAAVGVLLPFFVSWHVIGAIREKRQRQRSFMAGRAEVLADKEILKSR